MGGIAGKSHRETVVSDVVDASVSPVNEEP